eukprot:CAMPEP_0115116550 /NCGR_PEP_ID=MMETSP0227-20121206/43362_1 /TAXON_ID=89957 /ORGANISM="Polarella glacialis, Strain CCMP 1383" /LENGTH=36 /DNA_ID= /DNA_START= /DNA_END= /DNA_ORIENTATION=
MEVSRKVSAKPRSLKQRLIRGTQTNDAGKDAEKACV